MQVWKKLMILAVIGLMMIGMAVVMINMPNVAWNSGGVAATIDVVPSFNAAWNTGVSSFGFPIVHPNVAWNS